VDIVISLGLSHNHIQISMLDRVPAPAGKMAIQAAGGSAWTSDLLRDLEQVNLGVGKPSPRRRFFIGLGRVVTDQTVYLARVVEVEIGVLPPVSDMTARAAGPVAVSIDAEVIDSIVALAYVVALLVPHCVRRGALPVPMGAPENGLALLGVAGKAVLRDRKGVHLAFQLYKLTMIGHFAWMAGQTVSGSAGIKCAGYRSSYHGAVNNRAAGIGNLFRLLMAVHAELMVCSLEAWGLELFGVEWKGVANRTSNRNRFHLPHLGHVYGLAISVTFLPRQAMVADGTVSEHAGMLGMHETHRFVHIAPLADNRRI